MNAIGIDLGTTFSVVATVNASGRPEVVKMPEDGSSTTPSVVYFPETGDPLVGKEAKAMQGLGEQDVASFFKRDMGDLGFAQVYRGRSYSATDLSAIVLRHLKRGAEEALGTKIDSAVITVPAYFNNAQREATIAAAKQAGFRKVLRIINEPTAAAIAFGLTKTAAMGKTTMVYDLGGGTFDVSIVKVTPTEITVLATDGDHRLGGKNWDDRIAQELAQRFKDEFGTDPFDDVESFNDLLVRCENAKKDLSQRESTRISVVHGGDRGNYTLTRAEFEGLTRDLLERTRIISESVLAAVPGLNWNSLDGVLLVGGSTRMQMVGNFVQEMTGRPPLRGINVDEAVALGAALQAASDLQSEGEFELEGTRDGGGEFTLPTITDVTSHSLGMVAENGDRSKYVNSILIAKNSTIPKTETKPYTLRVGRDRTRNKMEVYMLQGEDGDPLACDILGKYVISDIEPVSGGKVTLEVGFSYNKNGTVDVTAVQRDTGRGLPVTKEPVPEDRSWLARSPKENDKKTVVANVSVVIAVDTSGSMYGPPMTEAKRAASTLARKLSAENFHIGVLAFSDQEGRLKECMVQHPSAQAAISKLEVGWGGGNSDIPFRTAKRMMNATDDKKFLVLLTDGCWNSPQKAIKHADEIKADGVEIIAIGFGGADHEFLRAVASCDENALMTDLSNLVDSFSTIGQVLAEGGGTASLSLPDSEAGASRTGKGFLGKFFSR